MILPTIQKIIHKLNTFWFYFAALTIITLLLHKPWFDPSSVLSFGDWYPWSGFSINRIHAIFRMWVNFSDFGESNIQPNFVIFKYVWGWLYNLGLSNQNAIKLNIFVPLALLVVWCPYLYFGYKTKSNFIGFIVAIFYSSTTYILLRSQGGHTLIAISYAIAPLLFYLFEIIRIKPTWKNYGLLTLLLFVMIGYELRISLITFCLLILHMPFNKGWSKTVFNKKFGLSILLIFLTNLYWFLPIALSKSSDSIAKVANRGLFGNHLFDLNKAATLSESAWTAGFPNNFFVSQPVQAYLWITPILCIFFAGVAIITKKFNYIWCYFTLISLIGILLTKQSAEPFPLLYRFLYEKVPGFNLFREASKFYLITAFGYTGLLALGLKLMSDIKWKYLSINFDSFAKAAAVIAILSISFMNQLPIITGEIGGMYKSRLPNPDNAIVNQFINDQPDFSRFLWLPSRSSYADFSDIHPYVTMPTLNTIFETNKSDFWTNTQELFNKKDLPKFLTKNNIKYIGVPTGEMDRDGAPLVYYGEDKDPDIRSKFIKLLDRQPYLSDISAELGLSQLKVYKLKDASITSRYQSLSNLYQINKKEFNADNLDQIKTYLNSNTELTYNDSPNSQEINSIQKAFEVKDILGTPTTKTISKDLTALPSAREQDILEIVYPKLFYSFVENKLEIYSKYSSDLQVDGQKTQDTKKETLFSQVLVDNDNLEIKLGSQYRSLTQGSQDKFLARTDQIKGFEIYRSNNSALNEGFDDGFWQDKVGDCNNADDSPKLQLQNITAPENNYVNLQAERHIACIKKALAIIQSGQYKVSLRARSNTEGKATDEIGYYLGLNKSPDDPVIFKKKQQVGKDWTQIEDYIDIPMVGLYDMFLYAYGNGSDNASIDYDNISIIKIDKIYEKQGLNATPEYRLQDLKDKKNLTIEQDNLINQKLNEKFDNGFWSKQLGDCLNYDKDPKIGQEIKAQDNQNYLSLFARRHFACTNKIVSGLELNRSVNINLDYKISGSNDLQFYLSNGGWNKVERIKSAVQNQWQNLNFSYNVLEGGDLGLGLYSLEKNATFDVYTDYDNIKITDYSPDLDTIYILPKQVETATANQFTENYINSTDRQLKLGIKDASQKLLIYNSENYNSEWNNIRLSSEKIKDFRPEVKHYETVYGFNTFEVDISKFCGQLESKCLDDKSIILDINFKPQKWMNLGIIISGSTLVAILLWLVYLSLPARFRKNPFGKVKSQIIDYPTPQTITDSFDQMLANNKAKAIFRTRKKEIKQTMAEFGPDKVREFRIKPEPIPAKASALETELENDYPEEEVVALVEEEVPVVEEPKKILEIPVIPPAKARKGKKKKGGKKA
ncbi:MAG: hypothetical protein H7230_04030 [Candidatus Parcubacteria bacterium]|nr:hypothetical protein [Candidatus Paceibacterota bacterium]